jgi:hypothetical protein
MAILDAARRALARIESQKIVVQRSNPGELNIEQVVQPLFNPFEQIEQQLDLVEREAIALNEGGVPAVYVAAFAAIQCRRPKGVPTERWNRFINDAGVFLDKWGGLAERLGWKDEDLFGLDRNAPMARYDRMGLIWLLKGQTVTGLDSDSAVLSGGLKYRRRTS